MKGEGRRILVAPLNWGLGHASRCIPLVRLLLEQGYEPVLAGDGPSLELLSSEFPSLRKYQLPSYDIRYAKYNSFFKLKLLSQAPQIQKTVFEEHNTVEKILEKEQAIGLISDNRFGVYSKKVTSVYLTHQVWIKAGWLSRLASKWHQNIISRFDHCWVCDFEGSKSLAGDLSSGSEALNNLSWIGPLSRFSLSHGATEKKTDICVVLSGPEPMRGQFEKKVEEALKGRDEKVVLVRGIVEEFQIFQKEGNITRYNFMGAEELENAMRQSRLVISRSGYSSIMDLRVLGSRAILVPTPGQTEQEYLADRMQQKGMFPCVSQKEFSWKSIEEAFEYPMPKMKKTSESVDLTTLFDVFQQSD